MTKFIQFVIIYLWLVPTKPTAFAELKCYNYIITGAANNPVFIAITAELSWVPDTRAFFLSVCGYRERVLQ